MAGCWGNLVSPIGRVKGTFFRQILSSKSSRPLLAPIYPPPLLRGRSKEGERRWLFFLSMQSPDDDLLCTPPATRGFKIHQVMWFFNQTPASMPKRNSGSVHEGKGKHRRIPRRKPRKSQWTCFPPPKKAGVWNIYFF